MTVYTSGNLTIECQTLPALFNLSRSSAALSSAFIAAWLNMCGLDVTKATDGVHRDSNYDPDEFPGKSGTYEYVVQALRSTRAS